MEIIFTSYKNWTNSTLFYPWFDAASIGSIEECRHCKLHHHPIVACSPSYFSLENVEIRAFMSRKSLSSRFLSLIWFFQESIKKFARGEWPPAGFLTNVISKLKRLLRQQKTIFAQKFCFYFKSLWISGNPWFAALFPLVSHSQGVTITAHQNM